MTFCDSWQSHLDALTPETFSSGLSPFRATIPKHNSSRGLRIQKYNPQSPFLSRLSQVKISGSKSFTNRALVLAGLSRQAVDISGVLLSDDSFWALYSLNKMGFGVQLDENQRIARISPQTLANPLPHGHANDVPSVFFGMAGTLARFFPAVILNQQRFLKVKCLTTARLAERPIVPLWEALKKLGVVIEGEGFPCTINAGFPKGTTTISGAVSGQFLSGLLLCAAGSSLPVEIQRVDSLVQPDYVRMTLQALTAFGANLEADQELTIFRNQESAATKASGGLPGTPHYSVEADASTACYFIAWSFLQGIPLTITNLGHTTLQPDLGFVSFLRALGAEIDVHAHHIQVHKKSVTPLLKPTQTEFDFSSMSDQALTAGAVALFASEPIAIRGVAHIRHHESDRIRGFCQNVTACGGHIEEFEDGFRVHPAQNLSGKWATYHDHRFAMAGFLVACGHENVGILDPHCVSKTAPDFFHQWQELGLCYVND